MTTRPRLLLVAPVFHGYWRSIADGFRQNGFDIDVHCYDHKPNLRAKLTHKLSVELPQKLGVNRGIENSGITSDTASAIRAHRPNITLVIRGDQFGDEVFAALDAVASKRYVWLWDEVRRTAHTDSLLDQYDHVISYSPNDAAAFQASGRACLHLPNAFDPAMTPTPRHTNEVVFIGARYPRREQLLTDLARAGIPIRAFGRDWSSNPIDLARTWQVRRPAVPAARDIARLAGYELTAGAPAAINIHGDQDGFTMKTFEVPGVGGVQLIDRADVAAYYEPGTEVAVFNGDEELADLCRRAISDDRWGDAIRDAGRRRTLAEHTWAHRAAKVAELWA